MIDKRDVHIGEDRLLRSVVDEADLDARFREHLSGCPECRAERDRLTSGLSRMGAIAAELSPRFSGRVILPPEKTPGLFQRPWRWQGLRTAGAMAAVLVLVLCPVLLRTGFLHKTTAAYPVEAREYYNLLAEVDSAQEDSLPRVYTEIAGEDSGFNEDFMDFLSPANPDENPASNYTL